EDGRIHGFRVDRNGKPLTTELTAEGEKQLEAIATATPGGKLIRAEKGSTGIEQIAAELKRQMRSEFAEQIETVYADIYFYPLGAAILLLFAEVFLTDASRRMFVRREPPKVTGSAAAQRLRRALRAMGSMADTARKESKRAPS